MIYNKYKKKKTKRKIYVGTMYIIEFDSRFLGYIVIFFEC